MGPTERLYNHIHRTSYGPEQLELLKALDTISRPQFKQTEEDVPNEHPFIPSPDKLIRCSLRIGDRVWESRQRVSWMMVQHYNGDEHLAASVKRDVRHKLVDAIIEEIDEGSDEH